MSLLSRIFGAKQKQPVVTSAALLEQIANKPMLMAPLALQSMIAAAESATPLGDRQHEAYRGAGESQDFEHLITVVDGIGYVRIHGPLFPHYDVYTWWYGGSAYDEIAAAVEMLGADAGITQIVLDIDSNGGRVQGCFECARRIRAVAALKPITAYINDAGYSAGYALASAATRIGLTQTGGVGSIGVIATHVDYSRALDQMGIKYTFIISGEKKADLSPMAPLGDRARAELQDEINRLAELFFALVAEHRPALDVETIRAMQAGTYHGPGAVAAGLADQVGDLVLTMEDDSSEDPAPAPVNEPDAAKPAPAQLSAEDRARLDRATVADMLADCSLPAPIVAALLKPSAGVTPDTAAQRIDHARALHDMCFAAGLPDVAADYAARNVPLEAARQQLIDAKATDGPELVTTPPQPRADQLAPSGPSATSIRSRLRTAAAGQGLTSRQGAK